MADSASDELHQRVLKRCLPQLVRDLDFDGTMDHIVSREIFTDVQIRDMQEQPTTTEKIRRLINSLMKRGFRVYEIFLECLNETSQDDLRTTLENKYRELEKEVREQEEREIEEWKLKGDVKEDRRSPCVTPEKENLPPDQGQTIGFNSNPSAGANSTSGGTSPGRITSPPIKPFLKLDIAAATGNQQQGETTGGQPSEAKPGETNEDKCEASSTEYSSGTISHTHYSGEGSKLETAGQGASSSLDKPVITQTVQVGMVQPTVTYQPPNIPCNITEKTFSGHPGISSDNHQSGVMGPPVGPIVGIKQDAAQELELVGECKGPPSHVPVQDNLKKATSDKAVHFDLGETGSPASYMNKNEDSLFGSGDASDLNLDSLNAPTTPATAQVKTTQPPHPVQNSSSTNQDEASSLPGATNFPGPATNSSGFHDKGTTSGFPIQQESGSVPPGKPAVECQTPPVPKVQNERVQGSSGPAPLPNPYLMRPDQSAFPGSEDSAFNNLDQSAGSMKKTAFSEPSMPTYSDNDSSVPSKRTSSLSLNKKFYELKDHFDACVLFAEDDEEAAVEFKDYMESIELDRGQNPKLCLYNDEDIFGAVTQVDRIETMCKHCTLILIFISEGLMQDDYLNLIKQDAIMASLRNSKVRPILPEKMKLDDPRWPFGLKNAATITWYRRETKYFKENMKRLFNAILASRVKREAENITSSFPAP